MLSKSISRRPFAFDHNDIIRSKSYKVGTNGNQDACCIISLWLVVVVGLRDDLEIFPVYVEFGGVKQVLLKELKEN